MSVTAKLGLFGLALVAVFAVTFGAGRLVGPASVASPDSAGEHDADHPPAGQASTATVPGGLQVAQDGYRLTPVTTTLSTKDTVDAVPFQFRVLGSDGQPVTAYTTAHDKDLHLIVVRRDLTGFQHVHPTLGADGVWSVPLRVNQPGAYRVFADFQPKARDKGLILGVDVTAPGDYHAQPLPRPSRTSTVDGYTVTLDGELLPGTASKLTLSVSKDGVPVTDLQPYLGAFGHLVALRDGDLAYLHVHPEESKQAGPRIVFYAEVPSTGAYRLFLDFQHNGTARTAEFTATAGGAAVTASSSSPAHGGHG